MATSRVSVLLIFIGTFSLFNTNYALNQAEILNKVIRSPRQINNPLFDGSLAVDTDPGLVITPKFITTQHKLRKADSFAWPTKRSRLRAIFRLCDWPGCSSLGYGAMEEVERFPEFKNRDFFIVGESYAGHYIPQLADVILRKNKLSIGTSINLKGIAIGNAYIDKVENDRAQYEYFWRHAFIDSQQPETTVPTIQKMIGKGLRVWLYSGDIDSVVPIVATKNSVKSMRLPVKKEWRPWFSNQQVGGYVEEYEGLTLATVRGSGHMVPTNQPHRALDLITNFLQGKSLPEITSSDD
ncbi:hypothetical protein LUZ60_002697 [Juncus effusus]|nr:hypothetical protein LUZ60_002697 [Juncus effusus]